ncbi:MAG: OFA family MFS transporter [Alphaproteobacteria bacterium GM202ARS2]|nr:OFA family MFS transporter [Alphaproteobacteria bacterium GM202ARS2]
MRQVFSDILALRLHKRHIIAPPDFNRWWVPPASIAIHLCIGSVYAWSLFNPPLARALGVVAPAAGDWELASIVWVFSVAIVFQGLAAACVGKWLEDVGPRMVGVVAACLWGGGFIVGGLGILYHQLWLVYLGYGVLGGCGIGLGYISPVSILLRWFPDRRGMATGMAIMGFGGGAIIGAPAIEALLAFYQQIPTYLGAADTLTLSTIEGVRYVQNTSVTLTEVVLIGAKEASQLATPAQPVAPGVYVVGTGSTGTAATFFTLGVVYFIVMIIAAFAYRVPAKGWLPKNWQPPDESQAKKRMMTTQHVHIDQAMKTQQFYLLWLVVCLNVTAGIGILGVAKTMMSEIFGTTLPHIVDAAFTAQYVLMISVFNMLGRFFWASASDYIGRKITYTIFCVLGIFLYLSIPYTAQHVSASPHVQWLVMFYAVTMMIFTMYGGSLAAIPAYLADIFGTRYVGGIHGRLLTALSAGGVLGPVAITQLREYTRIQSIESLVARIDPQLFQQTFGQTIDQLPLLIEAHTVTIAALMDIAPIGTIDPSPTLYNTTMYVMACLLAVAWLANTLVRPVHTKHHM